MVLVAWSVLALSAPAARAQGCIHNAAADRTYEVLLRELDRIEKRYGNESRQFCTLHAKLIRHREQYLALDWCIPKGHSSRGSFYSGLELRKLYQNVFCGGRR